MVDTWKQWKIMSWATETVLSPWLATDEARVSHVLSHVVWWKKNVAILKQSAGIYKEWYNNYKVF